MKPLKLEMTAFGSYAEKTVVDFENLSSNLYLITGDTGAGKTTIFDAIVFALYGAASGSERDPAMMHSDFVGKDVPTLVRLSFSHLGKNYCVERKMYFQKKRGTVGEYGDVKHNATLTSEGMETLNVPTKVTNRCAELIGLNKEQFCKIVMLAQGEFREFLKADSKKRSEILGKLFDDTPYVRFQSLLYSARDKLEKQRKTLNGDIDNALGGLKLPDNIHAEDRILYQSGHSNLVENLDALKEEEEKRLTQLQEEWKQYNSKISTLSTQKGNAEAHNARLDELKGKNQHLEELEKKQAEMDELRTLFDVIEWILHQINPLQNQFQNADEAVSQSEKRITRLEQQQKTQKQELDEAVEAVIAQQPNRDCVDALNSEITNIQNSIQSYKALAEAMDKEQRANQEKRDAEAKRDAAKELKEKADATFKKIKTDLEELSNVDREEADAKQAVGKAKEQCDALEAVIKKRNVIDKCIGSLSKESKKLGQLLEDTRVAETHYHDLYQRFLDGQSGILAVELKKELDEKHEAYCPVCRTHFCVGDHIDFAPMQAETPTREEVDRAQRDADKKDTAYSEQDKKVAEENSRIEAKKAALLGDAKKLLPDCTDWEMLSSEGYLEQQLEVFEKIKEDADSKYAESQKRRQRRDTLRAQQTTQTDLYHAYDEQEKQWNVTVQTQNGIAIEAHTEVEALRKSLDYADEATARAVIKQKEDKRDVLKKAIDDAENAQKNARGRYDQTSGSLQQEKFGLSGLEERRDEAEQSLNKALQSNGFESLEQTESYLNQLNGQNGEVWLRKTRNELNNFDNDIKNTGDRIAVLLEETKDYQYTDLTDLEADLAQKDEKRATIQQQITALSVLMDNHKHVHKQVSDAKKALKATDAVWNRLSRLGTLAIGENAEGGKLNFSNYVMGAAFREIIEMANRRLNIMSGGKYELEHSMVTGRANAVAGLEIVVLDHSTGKQRDSKTLSGGEGFYVSLALALGLSDVVQNRAGGTAIDALFIDEGFGTLNDSTLDKAIEVLQGLTTGNRMVGIISHVAKLEESITTKIVVKNNTANTHGSSLSIVN